MSGNDRSNTPPSPTARRTSTAGQRLSEFFGRSPTAAVSPSFPGSITAAAHQATQQRRMSIATVGLGASPGQPSPFTPHGRQDSFSSNGSGLGNESAIDDSSDVAPPLGSSPTFRRLSFGSRAMSQMSSGITNGESGGFNWSDEMRNRAQRSASITSPTGSGFPTPRFPTKSASVATATPAAPAPAPIKPRQTPPDHFQERILKGDFYMD